MRALNAVLVTCTGRGMEQFSSEHTPSASPQWMAVDPSDPVPRVLTVPADQHSVGVAAGAFLTKHLHTFTEVMLDPHHRFWNNDKNALTECGEWEVVLVYTMMLNLNVGPFESQKWHRELEESTAEYA
eukprot:9441257-Lingulodinium_polyedra.AAC.1